MSTQAGEIYGELLAFPVSWLIHGKVISVFFSWEEVQGRNSRETRPDSRHSKGKVPAAEVRKKIVLNRKERRGRSKHFSQQNQNAKGISHKGNCYHPQSASSAGIKFRLLMSVKEAKPEFSLLSEKAVWKRAWKERPGVIKMRGFIREVLCFLTQQLLRSLVEAPWNHLSQLWPLTSATLA